MIPAAHDPSLRKAEVVRSLGEFRARLGLACSRAGREVNSVVLVAVTKRFPVEDARLLLELGVHDLGESRDQEAKVKAAELPSARWHFVGQLQTNKARSVARYASAVHSVDRPELVEALVSAVQRGERVPLPVFLQVRLDPPGSGEPTRAGVAPAGIDALAEQVAGSEHLTLAGLMAVAPLGGDADEAFARLAGLSQALRVGFPQAAAISAGMSGDLEAAIRHGATHVRVGTALLGPRTPDVG